MVKVIGVRFDDKGRIYYFSPSNIDVKKDEFVIVETERGMQFGRTCTNIEEKNEDEVFLPLKDIVRIANKEDEKTNEKNVKSAKKALDYAKKVAEDEDIDMKLYDASYTFDRKKLIFKFIADERVDFRNMAKILASKYKTRIELRQIGARDKAKEISGLGPCGRFLCCAEFLNNFDGVSINMAKNQGIALNPSKINGACGRLLCCLDYEDETYTYYKKKLPKYNELVEYDGKKGRVCEINALKQTYKINVDDNIIELDGSNYGSNK